MHEVLWTDRATPLPALRDGYVQTVSGTLSNLRKDGPIPSKIYSPAVLDLFDADHGLIHHPCVLYSATVAGRGPRAWNDEKMIWQRDRGRTFVLADSGGFSAVQDNLDVHWDIPESVDALRWNLLKWLEKVPDAAVHLDIPLRAVGRSRHFRTFQQCLDMTVGNVRHWAENYRNPNLKWVMPIHGRTIQEAELWWNALKQTGAPFDGIAIGGTLGFDLSLILGILVHIHQEGRLAACRLIHIFGHFSVNYFLTLSIVQKVLNEHVNPDIRVTFDASSPFWDAEHGNICHMKAGDEKVPFLLRKEKAVDFFFPDNIPIVFPAMSKVMAGINIQDICVKKGSLHTHDHLSYMLIGLHNLEVSLDAFSSAHSLIYSQIVFDDLYHMLIKKKLACGPVFDLLSTVRSIFTSKDPRLEIHANKKFLSSYL